MKRNWIEVGSEEYVDATFPTAYNLLQLWDRPDSKHAAWCASKMLRRAMRHTCQGERTPLDVLENPRVMESLEMVASEYALTFPVGFRT